MFNLKKVIFKLATEDSNLAEEGGSLTKFFKSFHFLFLKNSFKGCVSGVKIKF